VRSSTSLVTPGGAFVAPQNHQHQLKHRHVVSIVGPNGCGKGTACSYLGGLGSQVMTVSDILEGYRKKNPEADRIIHEHKVVKKVNVPDPIVADAMIWRLGPLFRQVHSGLFGLDGYGRGPEQIKLLAEWIEQRNEHYERIDRPTIKTGHVFFTLTFEETLRRIQKRIEEFREKGLPPRTEDLGEHPKRRYEEYQALEERLIATARTVPGHVTIIDLGTTTTLEAAAHIYAIAHEVEPEEISQKLRLSLAVVP
jgi:adenylate kinase family enzyme